MSVAHHMVPSIVRHPRWVRRDNNGFMTALAVRASRLAGRPVPGVWLDVLESCRVGEFGFSFWPAGQAPKWAPPLVPDADDSSVMAVELLHAGRIGTQEARRIACHGVAAFRAQRVAHGPEWIRAGMFAVWQRPGITRQLVDCTAATNALALLTATDLLEVAGVAETVAAISAGVEWAAEDALRLSSLSPFYTEPNELRLALAHAVAEGCEPLEPVAAALGDPLPPDRDATVCSSPYGLVTWHSPRLQVLRRA